MSLLNQVFQGNPSTLGAVAAGGSQIAPNIAVDTVNAALYLSTGNGWQPFSDALAKSVLSAQTAAAIANVLTFTPPATGLYRLTTYVVETTAVASVTLPGTDAAYTEGDTGVAQTAQIIQAPDTLTTGAIGAHQTGSLVVNAAAGVPIVISSTGNVASTYTIKARVEFIG
jgi:hypothetical protein